MTNRPKLLIYGGLALFFLGTMVSLWVESRPRNVPPEEEAVAQVVELPEPIQEVDLTAMVWPLQGQILRGVGLSYAQTFGDYRYHDGLDIQAARGAEVVAALAGKVIKVTETKAEGIRVVLEHDAVWSSEYAHLAEVYVQEADYCEGGTSLGQVNQPGLNELLEGPHLHFTLRREGEIVNPLDYLPPFS